MIPGLSADDLHAGYPARPVLDAVTLTVAPGELLAVIGPNGAGKSTLLRALARQLRPAGGIVTLDEIPLWSKSPGWAAQRIGLTVSGRPESRPLTVAESVALGRAPHRGWLLPLTVADRAAVAVALERAGLTTLANRPVGELSDGEAQRVGLARALAQEPRVLLVDEPTAHLDLRYQGETLDQLRRLARAGLAVAVALHDLNLAGLWADRVALLVAGRLAAVGSPAAVLTAETLTAAYNTPLSVTTHPEFGTPLVLPRPHPPETPA